MLTSTLSYRMLAALLVVAAANVALGVLVVRGVATGAPALLAIPLLIPPGIALGMLTSELWRTATVATLVVEPIEAPAEYQV
jgi:hypothetical protein